MSDYVESPLFGEKYPIGHNTTKVDFFCPLDETQLVSVLEYSLSGYLCHGCGKLYQSFDPKSLKQQATEWAIHFKLKLDRNRLTEKSRTRLEKLVEAAENKGLL